MQMFLCISFLLNISTYRDIQVDIQNLYTDIQCATLNFNFLLYQFLLPLKMYFNAKENLTGMFWSYFSPKNKRKIITIVSKNVIVIEKSLESSGFKTPSCSHVLRTEHGLHNEAHFIEIDSTTTYSIAKLTLKCYLLKCINIKISYLNLQNMKYLNKSIIFPDTKSNLS